MFAEKIFAVAHYVDQGILWILLFLSVMSLALIMDRFVVLRRHGVASQRTRERLKIALQTNHVEEVEEIARDIQTLEGRAAAAALKYIKENGSQGLEEMFSAFILVERPELEKSLGFLATLGSNAPYVGLLGTVLGIMKAFQDLASANSEAGQQTVMAGISVALVATAAGLFVAIPAVLAFNFYSKKVKLILQSVESVKALSLSYAKKKGV